MDTRVGAGHVSICFRGWSIFIASAGIIAYAGIIARIGFLVRKQGERMVLSGCGRPGL